MRKIIPIWKVTNSGDTFFKINMKGRLLKEVDSFSYLSSVVINGKIRVE